MSVQLSFSDGFVRSLLMPCECGKDYIGEAGRSKRREAKNMTGI